MNSREAISTRKCDPPFFTHVSVSCRHLVSTQRKPCKPIETDVESAELSVRILVAYPPFEGAHSILRRHRLRAYEVRNLEIEGNIFSARSQRIDSMPRRDGKAHNELDVARSICSSIWVEDANQPAIFVRTQGAGVQQEMSFFSQP